MFIVQLWLDMTSVDVTGQWRLERFLLHLLLVGHISTQFAHGFCYKSMHRPRTNGPGCWFLCGNRWPVMNVTVVIGLERL